MKVGVSSLAAVFALLGAAGAHAEPGMPQDGAGEARPPILIERQGSFAAGGSAIGEAGRTTLCDHGFVEFQIPPEPREVGLFLWHSSSTAAWQNRWDGGEGFQSIFLRRGFPVYLWDGPRVGRANMPCEAVQTAPREGQDQINFFAWRFGPSYPDWYPGVQFPTEDAEAWDQAMRARYEEFDTVDNARLQAHAAAEALERTGPVVLVTNSAAGLRALLTAIESDQVSAIVAYENVGYVFPDDEDTGEAPGPYGPVYVPREQFERLAEIPLIFVWGDNLSQPRGPQAALPVNRRFVELINSIGGQAEILELAEAGLHGNTHLPFADLNNVEVADLLMRFLERHHLDGRAETRSGE
ncbi:alpha/beta hydrolase [Parasphingopyxis marina]|uniref:Alpha/beta fold hydrolase n=1 Tax=Parasphingopyxis marina TaxID=2761622 RepID=A0A842HS36_9SPHN|nr:alpha/beta fold hydrolase [Parasphingopyxis marina]MBC2776648.1 alpha/beta fold hydrolase [Parasphingopyxis marina]